MRKLNYFFISGLMAAGVTEVIIEKEQEQTKKKDTKKDDVKKDKHVK